ncbi:MAG: hypothetical protein ACYC2T_01835 [Bacillota bacterium]
MKIPGKTKRDVEETFFLLAAGVTAVMMLLGIILWLSVKYVSLGSQLIILGAGVGVAGWLLAKALPFLFKYKEICCPSCSTIHKVTVQAGVVTCEKCGRKLFGEQFWKLGNGRTERERTEEDTSVSAREKTLRKRA